MISMDLHWIDWTIIVVFLIFSLTIGLYFRKRASKSMESFFLGNREMPWLVAGISMVATTFAADTPLAVTELVGKSGISGNWIWWSFLAGGMLTTFFFAKLWRRAEVLTETEFIELRYSGKPAAMLRGFKAVYLGLVMNILIIGWVNLAMITIIQEFFGTTPQLTYTIVACAMVFAAFYTSLSGIWGVAVTDVVQFTLAIVGTIVLAIVVVGSEEVGGIDGLKSSLPPSTFNFFPTIGEDGGGAGNMMVISFGAFFAYLGVQWWASWYPGQEPGGGGYVAQRMMSTKTEKGAVYATLFFQVAHYCLRPWPWILVALSCMVLYPELEGAQLKEGYVRAMKDFLPTGLKGLLLAAFLGAYLSTISTQLNWGAGYLANDLYKRFVKPDSNSKQLVTASRVITFLLMICGLVITQFMTSISGVWEFVLECGAGLGLVLILRWYWWRINAWSEISATVTPFIVYAVGKWFFDLQFPESFFLTVGVTTVVWILFTFFGPKEDEKSLKIFFDRVRPDGNWRIFRKSTVENRNNIARLAVCWLSSVTLTYGILFLTGKIIFKEWNAAMLYGAVVVISGVILVAFLKRTNVFR
jgi:SSS family solute:Na+ symporter